MKLHKLSVQNAQILLDVKAYDAGPDTLVIWGGKTLFPTPNLPM